MEKEKSMKKKYLTEKQTKKLKMILLEKDMTIGQVAEQMGLSRPALSNRIHGRYDFTRSEMERFSEITGVNPIEAFDLTTV